MSVVIPVRDPAGLALTLRALPTADISPSFDDFPAGRPGPSGDGFPAMGPAGPTSPLGSVDEVIVVCDGHEAAIAAVVRSVRPDALVLRPGRPGSGNALATGLAASSCDIVVTLTGDGSTDPGEIPRYVAALTAGADVAVGSRYREGGRDLTGGRFRRWLNLTLIRLVNTLFGTDRTDPGFGYAAFRRDALNLLDLPDPAGHAQPCTASRRTAAADPARTSNAGPLSPAADPHSSAADRHRSEADPRSCAADRHRSEADPRSCAADHDSSAADINGPANAEPCRPAAHARPRRLGARTAPAWGDGPELNALLSLRPSAMGLRVTEVGSIAYPRMSRRAHTERPGLRHWLGVLATEYRNRDTASGEASAGLSAQLGGAERNRPESGGDRRPLFGSVRLPLFGGDQRPSSSGDQRPSSNGDQRPSSSGERHRSPNGDQRRSSSGDRRSAFGGDRRSAFGATGATPTASGGLGPTYDMQGTVSDDAVTAWPNADRRPAGEPIWGPPHRRPSPARDLWMAGDNPAPHVSPRPLANSPSPSWHIGYLGHTTAPDAKPRSAEDKRPDPAQARTTPPQPPAPREVGLKRRRLEVYRQRPDLRVINGEGTGGGHTRSGRLRPVPRENLGG